MAIKNHMIDEEGLITDIDQGFTKNQSVMKQTIGKIDKLMTSASSSVMCYLLLFVFMVLALLFKHNGCKQELSCYHHRRRK